MEVEATAKELLADRKTLRINRKAIEKSPSFRDFEPISVKDINVSRPLPYSVYFPVLSESDKYGIIFEKLIPKGENFPAKLKKFFQQNNVKEVYVHKSEYEEFLNTILEKTASIVTNPYLKPEQKLEIVHRVAHYITKPVMSNPRLGKNIERAQLVIEYYTKFVITHRVSAYLISKFFSKDYNLFAHSVQVAFMTIGFAHFIKQPVQIMPILGIGAFLHDVGKVELPSEIINKPGKLTDEEFEIIKQHPQFGYDILKQHKGLKDESLDIVIQHHERADGDGYPHGLKLLDINPLAQITHIVDCYDAMTMSRPYKKAYSPFETLKIMCTEMKGSFNTKLLELFVLFLGY